MVDCTGEVMFNPSTQSAIDQELLCAENARLTGNEGKARVCARRAAGIALRALFKSTGDPVNDPSVYTALNRLFQLETTPDSIKQTASRLLTRVAPDYTLPIQIDLIADARELITWAADQIRGEAF